MNNTTLQTHNRLLKVNNPDLPITRMTNTPIVLDFVAPPLRVVQISELIYTILTASAVNFTPPSYKTMKACAGIFQVSAC